MTIFPLPRHWLRRTALSCLGVSASISALLPQMAMARPWPIPQSRWSGSVQDYPGTPPPAPRPWWSGYSGQGYGSSYGIAANNSYQAYGNPPLTPEQQVQRCNTGRLIGGLGGGAVAYAISRNDGRAWAIPLGALLGSQVGCNAAAGRGPLPW